MYSVKMCIFVALLIFGILYIKLNESTTYTKINVTNLTENLIRIIQEEVKQKQLTTPHNRVIWKDLYNKVRVICWIMTSPSNREEKAIHVKATWGKRCNRLIFMSSESNDTLPTVDLGVEEGRNNLWGKTKEAFKYVFKYHQDEYDWVLKADDDTYVIVENLRYMLSLYDPMFPIYFGSNFRHFSKQGYMSGGGGYVLSKEAVRVFVEEALPDPKKCKESPSGAEDAEMGKCLNNTGVLAGDSRDEVGRGRFFPFNPRDHLIKGHIGPTNWYWDYIKYPIENGLSCCSDTAITFHYVPPWKMYEMEYLIYKLTPFELDKSAEYPPKLPPDINSIPKSLLEKLKEQIVDSNKS